MVVVVVEEEIVVVLVVSVVAVSVAVAVAVGGVRGKKPFGKRWQQHCPHTAVVKVGHISHKVR